MSSPISRPIPRKRWVTTQPRWSTMRPMGRARSPRGAPGSFVPWVLALLIAGGIAGALFFTQEDDKPPKEPARQQAAPEQGLACPSLEQAARAHESGDRAEFEDAIERAAAVAEETLQTSGQSFGKPERLALEIEQAAPADIGELLVQAEKACSSLG